MTGTFIIVSALAIVQPAIIAGETKKSPIGGIAQDFFGRSAAISGDTAVVGAQSHNSGGLTDAGAAYVFVRNGANWNQVATLTASDGVADDTFGAGADIFGDTIVVGAPTVSGGNPGAAYVFEKPVGGWADMTETAKLTASDGAASDFFGFGVAIENETIVAGAREAGAMDQGGVYVFVKPGGGWTDMTETAKLTASDAGAEDLLGIRVAISGDTVVSGAPNHGNTGVSNLDGPGAAYVFVKPPAGWANITESAKLTATDAAETDFLGLGVAIDGDTIVAGAANDGNSGGGTQDGSGSAYVFNRPADGWVDATQDAKLIDSNPQPSAFFGFFAAIHGERIVVGAFNKFHSPMTQDGEGAAYLYVEPAGGWNGIIGETEELTASDALLERYLGYWVDISADWILVGAPADGTGDTEPGAAYFFAFDDDEDGAPNYIDNCPDDPDKLDAGPCGCGVAEIDSDGDGIFDCNDVCPADATINADSDGDGVCDSADVCAGGDDTIDTDGDGTPDDCDDSPAVAMTPAECCGGGVPAMMPFMLLGWKRRRRTSTHRRI